MHLHNTPQLCFPVAQTHQEHLREQLTTSTYQAPLPCWQGATSTTTNPPQGSAVQYNLQLPLPVLPSTPAASRACNAAEPACYQSCLNHAQRSMFRHSFAKCTKNAKEPKSQRAQCCKMLGSPAENGCQPSSKDVTATHSTTNSSPKWRSSGAAIAAG